MTTTTVTETTTTTTTTTTTPPPLTLERARRILDLLIDGGDRRDGDRHRR